MCPLGKGSSKSSKQAPDSRLAKLWILLVGVNQYEDSQSLPSLQYSALDCQGLGEALKEATASFAAKEVIIHHDFVSQRPNISQVQASIDRIVKSASSNDTILFYFSGHGILEETTQQVVLCLADTKTEELLETGLPLNSLLKQISDSTANQQLVWLDACHSGGMTLRGTSRIALPETSTRMVEVLRNKAAESKGFYALLSCDRAQQSWEFPELGHGVFTYYLMRGLRGEAADAQGTIEADSLYQYVYHQTLRYIDKTNQQIRLINQQKSSRGERRLRSEFPLQTPKRIVEGFGKVVLGKRSQQKLDINPRQALVVDGGVKANRITLALSQILQAGGGFNLRYFPQTKESWSSVKGAIANCLHSLEGRGQKAEGRREKIALKDTPREDIATALLYLRGEIEIDNTGESHLVLGDNTRISRSWLRKMLRDSHTTQQIIILDCPGKYSVKDWIEDLRLEADRGQCLIAANSPLRNSGQFAEAILNTLKNADPEIGLPIAAWITQLQIALAGTGIVPQVWLSGTKGVIEVLPPEQITGASSISLDLGICPYMGLQAFDEDSAEYFYGRESLVQKLLNQINHNLSMAVVGASGSGKSSVVRAGLLAQLQQGKQIPGSDRWWLGSMRPGSQPIKALAEALVDPGSKGEQVREKLQIEGLLYQGVEGFVRWLRNRPETMVLLVVDQFEELFTLAGDKERQDFIELILGALKFAGDRFKLVCTIRADFVATCLEIPELARILQKNSILVPPYLTEADYRRAVVKPAQQVGLEVESGLVEVLLQDLDRSAGDLPLLQFALQKLWEKRDKGKLTLDAYQKLGKVQGALEQQAQAVYDRLDAEAQDCARWIFLNLTQLGEGTEDTRRRITKSELIVEKYPQELIDRTLKTLTDAKLLVVNLDDGTTMGQSRSANPPEDDELFLEAMRQEATVEVVHEILIRHWSSLRWWLEENRSRLRSQRQIEQAAVLWQQKDKQDDFLLRGVRLAEAEEIYIKHNDELSDNANEFVAVCIDARLAEQKEARKRLRKAQLTATALGILGLTATAFGITAYRQKLITQLENIDSLNSVAEAQLLSNQQLESLTTSVKAGKQLKDIKGIGRKLVGENNWQSAQHKTTATLQQSIYNTQEINRLEGHAEQVNAIAYSPDGIFTATASDDGTIAIWDKKGELLNTFKIHQDRVTDVAIDFHSEDSNSGEIQYSLISTGADGKAIWTILDNRGKEYSSNVFLVQSDSWLTKIIISRKSGLVALGDRNGKIYLSSLKDKSNPVKTSFIAHEGWLNALDFKYVHGVGEFLASAGEDGKIKIWSVKENRLEEFNTISTNLTSIKDISFDKKFGNTIDPLFVAGDREIQLWNLDKKELLNTYSHPADINSFSTYSDFLVTTTTNNQIYLWQQNGTLQQVIAGHNSNIIDLVFTDADSLHRSKMSMPSMLRFVSTGVDKTTRIWQTPEQPLFKGETTISSVSYSPQNSHMFAMASWEGKINLWHKNNKNIETLEKTILGHDDIVNQIKYSPDGKIVASAAWDKTIKLWNTQTGKLIDTLAGHNDGVNSIAFTPDGQTLISGSEDKTIKIWDISDKAKLIKTLEGHTDSIKTVTVSSDGKFIASGGYDNKIKIWNIQGELLQTIDAHKLAITSFAFIPNSNTLVSASWDNSIKLWLLSEDGKTNKLLHTLTGHQDGVTTISLNSDGSLLASGSGDRTIKLWNTKTGELVKTLIGHTSQINSLAFSSDDKSIISGEEQQGLFWWNLDLDNLLTQGCDRLSDYLSTNPNVKQSDKNLCQ